LASGVLSVLPDIGDRNLICDAISNNCDTFCTRDKKTIISKREQLRNLPINIVSPTEWWELIKPWSGLWA
jgi:hypothetical protein